MSTTVMAAVWPLIMPPTPKAVLVSLADNANDHGVCWPSIATICRRTCFGKTAVIEAIAWLEQAGHLVADRENGRHSRYQITVHADLFGSAQPDRLAHRSASRSGPPAEPHRSATRTAPVRQADTNRKEPSLTVKSSAAPVEKVSDDQKPEADPEAWRDGLPSTVAVRRKRSPTPSPRQMSDQERRENLARHLPTVAKLAGVIVR
jgi:hypothetical protein